MTVEFFDHLGPETPQCKTYIGREQVLACCHPLEACSVVAQNLLDIVALYVPLRDVITYKLYTVDVASRAHRYTMSAFQIAILMIEQGTLLKCARPVVARHG